MLPKINPTRSRTWSKLNDHHRKIKDVKMKDLFAADPERFNRFHLQFKDILVDYSKNRITDETLQLLVELAEEVGVKKAIKDMFTGEKINETENRTVLHECTKIPGVTPGVHRRYYEGQRNWSKRIGLHD